MEAVLLVLKAVGIQVTASDSVIDKGAQETVEAVESSSVLKKAVEELQRVFEDSSSTVLQKAKAIFYLIKDSFSAGILWKITKGLCANMRYWDWIKTAAKVTAMIIAAIGTSGGALIAKIVLALKSAYELITKKLDNVTELDSIKKTIMSSNTVA